MPEREPDFTGETAILLVVQHSYIYKLRGVSYAAATKSARKRFDGQSNQLGMVKTLQIESSAAKSFAYAWTQFTD